MEKVETVDTNAFTPAPRSVFAASNKKTETKPEEAKSTGQPIKITRVGGGT